MSRPTMEDVAARAGVSRALVSLVMRESPRVSDRSRRAVLAAADELGYRPNLMARNLASRRTMTLGVVLNDLHNPFFAEIADGIIAAANAAGYRTVLSTGQRLAEVEQQAIETFVQFRTDGIVIVGAQVSDSWLEEIAGAGNHLVVVSRASTTTAFDTVSTDEQAGARAAVDHLVGLGHRSIVHLDGGVGAGANARRDGYVAAMRHHDLGADLRIIPGAFTEAAGRAGVERLLRDGGPPSAIFAANDLVATGALDALEVAGIEVPAEVSLVGFDNTALAALQHIGLTTVNQPREDMGALAVRCLVERIEHDRTEGVHHVVQPELVVRKTTAPRRT